MREDGLGEQRISGGVPPLAQHTVLHAPIGVCACQTFTQNRPSTCANTSDIGCQMGSGPVKQRSSGQEGAAGAVQATVHLTVSTGKAADADRHSTHSTPPGQSKHGTSWRDGSPSAPSLAQLLCVLAGHKSHGLGFGRRSGVATEGAGAWCRESTPPWEKNQKPGRHLMKAQWSRLMMPPLGAAQSACSWQGVLRIALNSLI